MLTEGREGFSTHVHVKAICGRSVEHSTKQGECSGSAAFCCSSKWLFPEETALACVPPESTNEKCVYLYIALPF